MNKKTTGKSTYPTLGLGEEVARMLSIKDICVSCGRYIPEGSIVCQNCRKKSRCERCDIKRDSPCKMCKHNTLFGCKIGKRKGGLNRKCFTCIDEEFCREKEREKNETDGEV